MQIPPNSGTISANRPSRCYSGELKGRASACTYIRQWYETRVAGWEFLYVAFDDHLHRLHRHDARREGCLFASFLRQAVAYFLRLGIASTTRDDRQRTLLLRPSLPRHLPRSQTQTYPGPHLHPTYQLQTERFIQTAIPNGPMPGSAKTLQNDKSTSIPDTHICTTGTDHMLASIKCRPSQPLAQDCSSMSTRTS